MQCSESMDNILTFNDLDHLPSPWNIDSECTQNDPVDIPTPHKSKSAQHSGYYKEKAFSCDANKYFEIKRSIDLEIFPMKISQNYLDTVKPGMLAIAWYSINPTSTSGNNKVKMSIGGTFKEKELESAPIPTFIAHYVEDASTVYNQDVSVKVTSTPDSASSVLITPLELLVDLPVEVGCFKGPAHNVDSNHRTTSSTEMTPAFCVAFCASLSNKNLRYTMVFGGSECLCREEIPDDYIPQNNDQCSVACTGDDKQVIQIYLISTL